jgi:acyl-coenzyme A synthetase/AMP-(fatty) acid ligase
MLDAPLIGLYHPDDVLAWDINGPRTAREFVSDVAHLADSLPDRPAVLNLLSNRYEFLVGFAAAMLRCQITLLPQSRAQDTLRVIVKGYEETYCLTNPDELVEGIDCVVLPSRSGIAPWSGKVPRIPLSQVVAIAFTSGSTGTPMPNRKTWGALVSVARATASRFGVTAGKAKGVVATVPHQHMFGLEASVMLPIQHGLVMHAGRPLFPEDIRTALEDIPGKSMLVTTPLHLRACIGADVKFPLLEMILSATSALTRDLARQAEQKFLSPVQEIFGFAEAGSVASRRTIETDDWQPLDGIVLERNGVEWTIKADYLPGPARFPDRLSVHANRTFRVLGRVEDQVNIAGHRASLGELNQTLLHLEGVHDGIFFLPDADERSVTRLMAFVVAPGKTEKDIREGLQKRIDPVFLPRPLFLVPRLPRNETGKLPREALRELAEHCIGGVPHEL